MSWNSWVSKASGCQLHDSILTDAGIFLFPTMSSCFWDTPSLCLVFLHPERKWPDHETEYSPPTSDEVKNV